MLLSGSYAATTSTRIRAGARHRAHAPHYLRPVIGVNEALWGMLDGMNDAGLASTPTFGGRFVHGPGMCIVTAVRYLLGTCDTVD